jgi:ferredoxin-NADP reductase
MPALSISRRLLTSSVVDLLVGPHGIDRYLELVRPDLTVHEARAEVIAVRRQTARSVTLTLRPNGAWKGFRAGQFVRVGIEIDGVRRSRTYSPASSALRRDGCIELTVTVHPAGVVSTYLYSHARPGMIVHLGPAQGEFVLPGVPPERLALISGGSGITPVLSMLRTLCDAGHERPIVFLHYARTAADCLYRDELEALSQQHPNLRVRYVATREGGAHVDAETITQLIGPLNEVTAAVCGPPQLIDATRSIWPNADTLISETFTPPTLAVTGAAASGTLRFLRTEQTVPIGEGTLLEQAEAAGLTPAFGCRMGICHTCTCRKSAGAVQNILTGDISEEEDEDIQLCVSVPAGDVALEI